MSGLPSVAVHSGGYYVNSRLRTPSRQARDEALAGKLWEVSARLTGLAT